MWVLIDEKLEMTQHCTPRKFYHILGCIKTSVTTSSREAPFPLPLCSCENPPVNIQLWDIQHKKGVDLLERVKKGHRDAQRSGTPLLWRQAEGVGIVQHGEEKAPQRLHGCYQNLKKAKKELERDFVHRHVGIGQGDMTLG